MAKKKNYKETLNEISEILESKGIKKTSQEVEDIYNNRQSVQVRDIYGNGYFNERALNSKNVAKNILGTTTDLGLGIAQGFGNVAEGLGDLLTYGAAGIIDAFGDKDWAEGVREEAKKNDIDNAFNWVREKPLKNITKTNSILGKKSQGITQGIGTMGTLLLTGGAAGAAGLGTIGSTVATTGLIGASSMGSGMSEAYQGGATDDEAFKYGLISGLAEAGSEMLFGGLGKGAKAIGLGKGLSSVDDMFAKSLASKFKSQLAKNLTEFTIKAGAEGAEEVISGFAQAVGKKLTYMKDEDLGKLIKDEDLLDQFIAGAVTSGLAQTPGLVKITKSGRDYITGNTANEQKVIDKEIDNRIKEQEEDGTKLSNKEKNRIAKQVQEDLQKGYISTKTIEDTLGYNEGYNKLKYDTENSLGRNVNANEDADLQLEARERFRDSIKNDDYLQESYNEEERAKQRFTTDLNEYSEEQRKHVQKFMDSGVFSNTRRSHEVVNFLSKLAADTGREINVVDTERLANSPVGINASQVNGYTDGDSIVLNIDSNKTLNTVVGHEITHILESNPELYQALADSIKEYATTKGEYDKRLAELTELYKNVENADVSKELTADLVGDYLFADQDFINNISTKNRNLFQKIFDEIKHLLKMVTAGSKEERQLEKAKKMFEEAYRNSAVKNAEKTNAVSKTQSTKAKDSNIRFSLTQDNQGRELSKEQQEYFKDSKVRDEEGRLLEVYHGSISNEQINIFDTEASPVRTRTGVQGTYFTSNGREAQNYRRVYGGDRNSKGTFYKVYLNITNPLDITNDIEKYEKQGMRFNEAKQEALKKLTPENDGVIFKGNTFNSDEYVVFNSNQIKNIDNTNPTENPDIRYSLSVSEANTGIDSDGEKLTPGQEKYFANSKVTDSKGNLQVVYHGTQNYDFNEFEGGIFLTDDYMNADGYAFGERVIAAYVNMENPLVIECEGRKWDNLDTPYGTSTREIVSNYDTNKYDGVIFENINDNWIDDEEAGYPGTVYYVNNSNQVKNIDNENPTNNPDIRYSISKEDSKGNSLTIQQQEYFKNSKIRDNEGRLIPMYHGTPNGEFTVFKPGSYFSADREYADGYQNTWASSISSGKVATQPKTYEVYLNITNPFSLQNEDAKNIYLNEFIKGGNSLYYDPYTDYTETINNMEEIDWTEGEDLAEWLKENHPEYDGLILDEGGDGGYGEAEYRWRGKSYMPFSSEQVKNINNQNPTDNPDIRYSLSSDAIRNLSNITGDSYSMLEANLGEDEYSAKRYLTKYTNLVKNYMKENNINVEPVMKSTELDKFSKEYRDFITNNDITVEKLAANEDLLNQYLNLVKNDMLEKELPENIVNNIIQSQRESFDKVDERYDIPLSLKRYNKEFDLIKNNITEIEDEYETEKKINKEVVESKQFQNYLDKITKPLFEKEYHTTEEIMEEAENNHGITEDYETGAYMTTNGNLLDFNDHGYRDDHRTIDAFGLDMNEFMEAGAIRMKPEANGFEMATEPTPEQYSKLYDYIDYCKEYKADRGSIDVDIDIPGTKNYDTAQYNIDTPTSKIINDIKTYFETGKFPKKSEYADFYYSLSKDKPKPTGSWNVYGKDVKYQGNEPIQQVNESINQLADKITQLQEQLNELGRPTQLSDEKAITEQYAEAPTSEEAPIRENMTQSQSEELDFLEDYFKDYMNNNDIKNESELATEMSTNFATDADKQLYSMYKELKDIENGAFEEQVADDEIVSRGLSDRELGKRKVKAYQYEHPEVKPYFQEQAKALLSELNESTFGERSFDSETYYNTDGELGWNGTKRDTSESLAKFKDSNNYTWEEIRQGLEDIINDNGAENNAVSKKLELVIDDRLRNGYKNFGLDAMYMGDRTPANREYINLLNNIQMEEAFSNIPMSEVDTSEDITEGNDLSQAVHGTANEIKRLELALAMKNAKGLDETIQKNVDKLEAKITKPDNLMDMFYPESRKPINQAPERPTITKTPVRKLIDNLKGMFVNENVEIDNLAKEYKRPDIKWAGDMVNNAFAEGQNDVTVAQTDNQGNAIGKSVNQLFQPAIDEGLYDAFNDYLINYSNIDRHNNGKGSQTPLNVSQNLVKAYEESYPQFKEWGKDVWNYGKNTRDNMLEAGLIDQNFHDLLGEMYPHYVPYISDVENINNYMQDVGEIKPRGIKKAYGKAGKLLPVQEALTKYTFSMKKGIRQNALYNKIVDTLRGGQEAQLATDDRTDYTNLDNGIYHDKNGAYLTAYENGIARNVRISEDLYNGLKNDLKNQVKNLEEKLSLITNPLQKLSNIRRNVLTSWSPTFPIKNAIKDFQGALFNSKHTAKMLKNYPGAIKELSTMSSPQVKQFVALYGSGNLMGQFDEGSYKSLGKNKFLRGISKANEVIELAPRYAEFKASIESGATLEEAMYNAREVTTNFSRGGTITKALNRNGFTFLNSSVQGFDKFVRNFSGENGAKGVVSALTKALMFGVAPALFNDLVFGSGDDKDEDYEALPNYIKDNYYLIKTGDNKFVRIPKGREFSVFGSAARRALEAAEGKENAFEGYFKNAWEQIGVGDLEQNNIIAPLLQAYGSKNGTAWYGGDLVPSRLQDKPKEEQYDASTDRLSVWLGQQLGISPYKLNYVIDQYTGGVGDLLLPLITPEAKSEGGLLAPITDQFTSNSTMKNKYASDFYTKLDELKVKKNSSKATDEDALEYQYMSHISGEMSKLYAEKREVQDSDLSKEDKYARVQSIQEQINDLAKTGLEGYKNVTSTSNYADVNQDMGYYKNAKGNWSAIPQSDMKEIESIGLTDEEKSSYFQTKNSIYDITENYKEKSKDATDEQKTILNTEKKRDIINQIQNSTLPDTGKAALYDKYYGSTDKVNAVIDSEVKFDSYLDLQKQNFTADKDKNGKAINGTKKAKVFNYINSMNIPYIDKCILAKLEYKTFRDADRDIIEYLDKNPNITYDEMVDTLKAMGFEVNGNQVK